MLVRVRLYANLVRYRPGVKAGQAFEVELEEASTLAHLVSQLELPSDQVKVIFVNGITVPNNHVIRSGDEIGMFSPIGGG